MSPPVRQEIEANLSQIRQTEAALGVARKAIKKFAATPLVQSDPGLAAEVDALRKRLKKARKSAKSVLQACINAGQD